jgi:hypothetical protein
MSCALVAAAFSGGITIKDSVSLRPLPLVSGLSLINKGNISQDTGKTLTVSKLNADASDPANALMGSVNLPRSSTAIGTLAGKRWQLCRRLFRLP